MQELFNVTQSDLHSHLFEIDWNSQLHAEIPADIIYSDSAGYQILRRIFQPAEVVLISHVCQVIHCEVQREQRFILSVNEISTQTSIQQGVTIGDCFCAVG